MSINLLEDIQSKMGYPPLQKIDPNTQEVKDDKNTPDEHLFSQAAIPAVLTALYHYSRTDLGALTILQYSSLTDWTDRIFSDNKEEIIQKIATYSNYTIGNTVEKMNSIAAIAVTDIKEKVPEHATAHDVKKFLADQRNNILPFLPAVLQMGEMLHDDTLDDRTHKMGGPVSSLMHAIGGQFSDGDIVEEKENK